MQAFPHSELIYPDAAPRPESDVIDRSAVLRVYRDIACVSNAMREAALCQNWARLTELGKDYLAFVQALRDCPPQDSFTEEERRARIRLLLDIIDNDALIRDLAQPELARIGRLISRYARSRTAVAAYRNTLVGASH